MGFLGSGNVVINYKKYGSGSRAILAFHGYGQDQRPFLAVKNAQLYSFDLPFHGESKWENSDTPISREWIRNNLPVFLKEEDIQSFSLMGYSIGCKLTQAILLEFPNKVDRVFWIAPDGVYQNFWYTLATKSPGKYIYSCLIHSTPGFLLLLSKIAMSIGLIPNSAYQLTRAQLKDPAKRFRAYHTWMVTRKLSFPIQHFIDIVNQYSIETYVFLGTRDKIINGNKVKKKLTKVEKLKLYELPWDHFQVLQAGIKLTDEQLLKY